MGTGVLSKGLPGLESEVRFSSIKAACRRYGKLHGRLQIAVEWSVADCPKVHLLTATRVSGRAQTAPGCSARQMAHVSMSHLCASARAAEEQTGVILAWTAYRAHAPGLHASCHALAEPVELI